MTLPRVFYRNAANRENRKDRRYQYPVLEVVLEGVVFRTHDWSLGGMALDPVDLAPGGASSGGKETTEDGEIRLSGRLSVPEIPDLGFGTFVAKLVRVDSTTGQIFLSFVTLSDESFTLMDKALARRLSGGRAGHADPAG